eukprot:Opistho-1_new@109269
MNPRKVVQQEEDAGLLRFGPVFDKAQCLLLDEVRLALEERLEESKKLESQGVEASLPEAFHKTLTYVQQFSHFKNPQAIEQVRRTLEEDGRCVPFQVASIANLCPETVDEARSLIPSLMGRFGDNDEELQELLDAIRNYRDFQS